MHVQLSTDRGNVALLATFNQIQQEEDIKNNSLGSPKSAEMSVQTMPGVMKIRRMNKTGSKVQEKDNELLEQKENRLQNEVVRNKKSGKI